MSDPFRADPIFRGYWCAEKHTGVTKFIFHVQNGGIATKWIPFLLTNVTIFSTYRTFLGLPDALFLNCSYKMLVLYYYLLSTFLTTINEIFLHLAIYGYYYINKLCSSWYTKVRTLLSWNYDILQFSFFLFMSFKYNKLCSNWCINFTDAIVLVSMMTCNRLSVYFYSRCYILCRNACIQLRNRNCSHINYSL